MEKIPFDILQKQKDLEKEIFNISTEEDFKRVAVEIFKIQSRYCEPYRKYISLLDMDVQSIDNLHDIPFLPVTLFKNHDIRCFEGKPEAVFTSSATTGMVPSSHPVKSLDLYRKSLLNSFIRFLGDPSQYSILALLPSYLERKGSSLVFMAEELIKRTGKSNSGFYLYNFDELRQTLLKLKESKEKTILLGVTFALLDFACESGISFSTLNIVETGGMKGRKREVSREEVHSILKKKFDVPRIGSEYGMAELMSQAWSKGEGLFTSPPWMKVLIRDTSNPFSYVETGKSGGVNIIDLANLYSCSFIETGDMGVKETGDSFRISGRINNSELRGCNLLLES